MSLFQGLSAFPLTPTDTAGAVQAETLSGFVKANAQPVKKRASITPCAGGPFAIDDARKWLKMHPRLLGHSLKHLRLMKLYALFFFFFCFFFFKMGWGMGVCGAKIFFFFFCFVKKFVFFFFVFVFFFFFSKKKKLFSIFFLLFFFF
jgi:hypothetical protein